MINNSEENKELNSKIEEEKKLNKRQLQEKVKLLEKQNEWLKEKTIQFKRVVKNLNAKVLDLNYKIIENITLNENCEYIVKRFDNESCGIYSKKTRRIVWEGHIEIMRDTIELYYYDIDDKREKLN